MVHGSITKLLAPEAPSRREAHVHELDRSRFEHYSHEINYGDLQLDPYYQEPLESHESEEDVAQELPTEQPLIQLDAPDILGAPLALPDNIPMDPDPFGYNTDISMQAASDEMSYSPIYSSIGSPRPGVTQDTPQRYMSPPYQHVARPAPLRVRFAEEAEQRMQNAVASSSRDSEEYSGDLEVAEPDTDVSFSSPPSEPIVPVDDDIVSPGYNVDNLLLDADYQLPEPPQVPAFAMPPGLDVSELSSQVGSINLDPLATPGHQDDIANTIDGFTPVLSKHARKRAKRKARKQRQKQSSFNDFCSLLSPGYKHNSSSSSSQSDDGPTPNDQDFAQAGSR